MEEELTKALHHEWEALPLPLKFFVTVATLLLRIAWDSLMEILAGVLGLLLGLAILILLGIVLTIILFVLDTRPLPGDRNAGQWPYR